MKKKNNIKLLSEKRFKWAKEENVNYIRNLTTEKSIKILEELTSARTLNEFIKFFTPDNPYCLKIGLKRRCQTYQKYFKR